MATLSETMKTVISNRVTESANKLQEAKEWVSKLKDSGFPVTTLEVDILKAESDIERMRGLLS